MMLFNLIREKYRSTFADYHCSSCLAPHTGGECRTALLLWSPDPKHAPPEFLCRDLFHSSPWADDVLALSFRDVFRLIDASANQLKSLVHASPAKSWVHVTPWRRTFTITSIGLAVERDGWHTPILMCSILAAQCTIIPLDSSLPASRLRDILRLARISLVIVEKASLAKWQRVLEGGEGRDRLNTPMPSLCTCDDLFLAEKSERREGQPPTPTIQTNRNESGNGNENGNRIPSSPSAGEDNDSVSHIYFTSGSTGTPKGIVGSSTGMMRYMVARNDSLSFDQSKTTMLASALTFDPCLGDVLSTWYAGGCIATAARSLLKEGLLAECIRATRATHMVATPSIVRMMGENVTCAPNAEEGSARSSSSVSHVTSMPSGLQVMALGGEVIPKVIVEKWGDQLILFNMYGTTEATVYQSSLNVTAAIAAHRKEWQCGRKENRRDGDGMSLYTPPTSLSRTIGHALGAECELVLCAVAFDTFPPAPLHLDDTTTVGEIWIRGEQVCLGYVRETQCDTHTDDGVSSRAQKIVHTSPFFLDENGVKWFRTGDLGRYMEKSVHEGDERSAEGGREREGRREKGRGEGERGPKWPMIEWRGRRDNMVKIRGNRIELEEVEHMIGLVAQSLVVVTVCTIWTDKLIAWIVPSSPEQYIQPPSSSSSSSSPSSSPSSLLDFDSEKTALLTETLQILSHSHLPSSLRPHHFMIVSGIPTTPTGKISRRLLAKYHARSGLEDKYKSSGDGHGAVASVYCTPLNTDIVSRLVATCVAQELGVPAEMLYQEFNIAHHGGDSLVSVRICKCIAQKARENNLLQGCRGHAEDERGGEDVRGDRVEGVFGEGMGLLAPAELMRRPILGSYIAHLKSNNIFHLPKDLEGVEHGSIRVADEQYRRLGDGENGKGLSNPTGWLFLSSCRLGLSSIVDRLLGSAEEGGKNLLVDEELQQSPTHIEDLLSEGLAVACTVGAVNVAKILMRCSSCPLNARDAAGTLALHRACASGSVPLLKLFVEKYQEGRKGDRVSSSAALHILSSNNEGQTIVHFAARSGVSKTAFALIVELYCQASVARCSRKSKGKSSLVSLKPPLDILDKWRRTPLHWAVINGHTSLVIALLEDYSCDASLRDAAGESALEMAERRARCGAAERPDGVGASLWGNIATILGGSGRTKSLKAKGYYNDK